MLIPIGHENLRGRRWPYITIAIIALNVLVFLGTHWIIEAQSAELGETRAHLLMLWGAHPELRMTDDAQRYVQSFAQDNPEILEKLKSGNRDVEDGWDARMRLVEDPEELQGEMDTLCQQFSDKTGHSLLQNYAYVPADPKLVSYVTSMFLHGGWLHLIFNMWFLWLAGTILEDTWGRVIYPGFYLLCGLLATVAHGVVNSGSMVPSLGASGAIAGLMGAFLFRFPKTKIRMMWFFLLGFRVIRFKFDAPAYALLPLWLGQEFLFGVILKQSSGVAHWAHIGGFAAGAGLAWVLAATGLEKKANQEIEAKVTWTAGEHMVAATDAIDRDDVEGAIASLRQHLAQKPDDVEAHAMLLNLYWRKQDMNAHRDELGVLCRVLVNARQLDQAWERYEEYLGAGGGKMHKAVWMELCRYQEGRQNWERASEEYQKLAEAYPNDRASVNALVSAARICGKQLFRESEAVRLYRKAQQSPVPHADLEATIAAGLAELKPQPVGVA
ncbi:MAG TPA: rhomboid family intramembrane serine protease [Patescibacteria group bacterium]|nr:rhomboid family intramembrane serine protease [Patescibacteria group bacterium]